MDRLNEPRAQPTVSRFFPKELAGEARRSAEELPEVH
jgi:hypothetical protein